MHWMKDGNEIFKDLRTKIEKPLNGEIKLHVDKVTTNDAGKYSAIAKNSFGEVKCEAEVKVIPETRYEPIFLIGNSEIKCWVVVPSRCLILTRYVKSHAKPMLKSGDRIFYQIPNGIWRIFVDVSTVFYQATINFLKIIGLETLNRSKTRSKFLPFISWYFLWCTCENLLRFTFIFISSSWS